jgi:hypothetical protein
MSTPEVLPDTKGAAVQWPGTVDLGSGIDGMACGQA